MSVQALRTVQSDVKVRFDELKMQVYRLASDLNLANSAIETIECEIDPEKLTDDQLLEYRMLRRIFDSLVDLEWEINYLQKPVRAIGFLHKNSAGRWAINDDVYFTCGSVIEFYLADSFSKGRWIRTTVEAENGQYYLVQYKDLPMEGLLARVRG